MINYGAPLTYSQWTNAWNDSSISDIDCLARVIYAEDTRYIDGEYAVAKEIYNRKHSGNPKLFSRDKKNLTWKNILFNGHYDTATDQLRIVRMPCVLLWATNGRIALHAQQN